MRKHGLLCGSHRILHYFHDCNMFIKASFSWDGQYITMGLSESHSSTQCHQKDFIDMEHVCSCTNNNLTQTSGLQHISYNSYAERFWRHCRGHCLHLHMLLMCLSIIQYISEKICRISHIYIFTVLQKQKTVDPG